MNFFRINDIHTDRHYEQELANQKLAINLSESVNGAIKSKTVIVVKYFYDLI